MRRRSQSFQGALGLYGSFRPSPEPKAAFSRNQAACSCRIRISLHSVTFIDQLEALPGPVAQLVPVLDAGYTEDVASDVLGEGEADLVDPPQLVARLLVLQCVVDDLLGTLAEAGESTVCEGRGEQARAPV